MVSVVTAVVLFKLVDTPCNFVNNLGVGEPGFGPWGQYEIEFVVDDYITLARHFSNFSPLKYLCRWWTSGFMKLPSPVNTLVIPFKMTSLC